MSGKKDRTQHALLPYTVGHGYRIITKSLTFSPLNFTTPSYDFKLIELFGLKMAESKPPQVLMFRFVNHARTINVQRLWGI